MTTVVEIELPFGYTTMTRAQSGSVPELQSIFGMFRALQFAIRMTGENIVGISIAQEGLGGSTIDEGTYGGGKRTRHYCRREGIFLDVRDIGINGVKITFSQ